ncbi:putative acyl-CoA transferase/carnitine dehydratase [Hoeflea sp. IMCC20628]|uniref:CaiB/BaiF CoA transferase family protein n=1 Tax=Hoeflea sp. IMCC20628 TaxID=1620421 RepID=UPI00063AD707|nr:CoA transferase [Hoeflea sp. IMCC20628]AKH98832.1 putative acyl-CoA transferase/carnitine dehydratase [Hoeflea sp. IMCC20628]
MSQNRGALAGLKVIDLTQMLAGPYCTMLLADQGADVIKIEPINGDPTRTFGPFPADDTEHHFGGYFQSTNRNKKSVAIDLKSEEGKLLFRRLARDADVVAENFRAGVMDRLGIGYEILAAENPKLVYAAIRGFGDPRTGASPYVDRPAFDVVAQAMGGAMGVTGPDAQTPMKIGPGVGDIFPAALAAFGIMAALRHAEKTGEGQFVDVAMYDGIVAMCERIIYQQSYTGRSPVPEGNQHPILCPFGTFSARDGQVTVGCPRDSFWGELTTIIGRPELGQDPKFATNNARLAHSAETIAIVEDWTSVRSKSEIALALDGRVPFGPVNTAEDIFADPHMAARQMLVEVEHPGSSKPVTIASTPVRMTKTPGGVQHRAPLTGEDTFGILESAGLTKDEIADLKQRSIIA